MFKSLSLMVLEYVPGGDIRRSPIYIVPVLELKTCVYSGLVYGVIRSEA